MENTKHTPGPWTYKVYKDKGMISIHIEGADPYDDIKDNTVCGIWSMNAKSQNDAKLIAAAPDMLNLIQEGEAWLSMNGHPSREEIQNFRKSLQEMIKKATE